MLIDSWLRMLGQFDLVGGTGAQVVLPCFAGCFCIGTFFPKAFWDFNHPGGLINQLGFCKGFKSPTSLLCFSLLSRR